MNKSYGAMCSANQAIEEIEKAEFTSGDMKERVLNRLMYMRDQDIAVKPKYHKGRQGRTFDYYTCGHCGNTIREIGDNYCSGCGFRIGWDSTRCLTGFDEAEEEKLNQKNLRRIFNPTPEEQEEDLREYHKLHMELAKERGCSTCKHTVHVRTLPGFVIGEENECDAGLECDTVLFNVKNCPKWEDGWENEINERDNQEF